jgi:hypothetical protein
MLTQPHFKKEAEVFSLGPQIQMPTMLHMEDLDVKLYDGLWEIIYVRSL